MSQHFILLLIHHYILHVDYSFLFRPSFLLVVLNNIWEMLKKKGDPYRSLEVMDWDLA